MLSLKNVKKSYDKTPVLKGISLDIEDGEIVSILGTFRMREDDAAQPDPGDCGGGRGTDPL